MIYRRQSGLLVKLDGEVVDTLRAHAQLAPSDLESGGVLLGRYLLEDPHVVVDAMTTPCPKDRRTRTSFRRSRRYHQKRIDAAWTLSGGTCVYLGEWHSHAEADPTPSSVDLRDWKRRMKRDTIGGESWFFLIAGQKRIRIWEGGRDLDELVECALDEDDSDVA